MIRMLRRRLPCLPGVLIRRVLAAAAAIAIAVLTLTFAAGSEARTAALSFGGFFVSLSMAAENVWGQYRRSRAKGALYIPFLHDRVAGQLAAIHPRRPQSAAKIACRLGEPRRAVLEVLHQMHDAGTARLSPARFRGGRWSGES